MPQKTLDRIARHIDSIPTLPAVYYTISSLLENPRINASDVTSVIARDPALTAKVLKIVNSAFYGLPQQVSTLTHAVVLLGFNTLKSLVLAMSLSDIFARDNRDGFSREAFWTHCFATGMLAKSIAIRVAYSKIEEVFIQGLLHDVGKIVLDKYAPDDFARVWTLTQSENILFREAETRLLNVTHTEIGGMVAKHWNLPERISRSIEMHHNPSQAGDLKTEASIIHLSDIICRAKRIGNGGDFSIPALDPAAWELLGLDWKDLEAIMAEAEGLSSCGVFFH